MMKKRKPNKLIFTLVMAIVFIAIAELGIWGYGGSLFIESIFNYPLGDDIVKEIVLAILTLIVMLLFKNFYVFTQKSEGIFKGLFYGLFCIIYSTFLTIFSVNSVITNGTWFTALNALILCLFVGICEEFLCRGWLLNEFLERYGDTKKGAIYSIIISSLIFGLMHLGNVAVQTLDVTIIQVINAIGIGLLFGTIYYKTKNIWSVIILHAYWDFALFLSEYASPVLSSTESIMTLSTIGLGFALLMLISQIYAISPVLFHLDEKPNSKTVIVKSVVGICLYITFTVCMALFSSTTGETYEYGTIDIDEYSIITNNYSSYILEHKIMNNLTNDLGETIETVESVNLNVYYEDNNIIIENSTLNKKILLECNTLYDFIVKEDDLYYTIAYLDYDVNSNIYLNYVYIEKTNMINTIEYLDSLKDNVHKVLLPDLYQLCIIDDGHNNISYIAAYDMDYGYYLLTNDDKILRLN